MQHRAAAPLGAFTAVLLGPGLVNAAADLDQDGILDLALQNDNSHGGRLGWLEGRSLLEVRDTTFLQAGSVGVWTKADPVTCSDDLQLVLHP